MSEIPSEDSYSEFDYRVPSAESFLVQSDSDPSHSALIINQDPSNTACNDCYIPNTPLKVDTTAESASEDRTIEISRLQNLCWELVTLGERLADEGAPDRGSAKEQLFLVKQKIPGNFLHTAAVLEHETELPSKSVKCPMRNIPDFDFLRMREFLAQHATSRYTAPLLRGLIHHSTWKFLEISDRRAFVLGLVAFDVFGGTPFVFARLAETQEIFLALICVLGCEWAGRKYIGKFPLLILVQNFFRYPVDSPEFIQGLAAFQRLSFDREIGNFLLECQLHEYLVSEVLTNPMHSEFSREFSLALISNLADLPDFGVSEGAMRALKNFLRNPEICAEIFAKMLKFPTLKDLAFVVGVDVEIDRLIEESEIPEIFRSLHDMLHGPSRAGSAEKKSDETLCFLEDEALAQLVIGNNPSKDTFVTKRFQGIADNDRKFFADFLAAAAEGRLLTSTPQAPKVGNLPERAKPKIWR